MGHNDRLEIEPALWPEIEKIFYFFVTTPGGLDGFAVQELRSLQGVRGIRVDRRRRQSRIHFQYDRSPRRLLDLRCVNGVYTDLGNVQGVTVGRPGMLRVAEALAKIDVTPAIALYDILHGVQDAPGLRVTCTVGRGHRFTAGELSQILVAVLADRYDLDPQEQSGPYTVHVSIERRTARIGFRLARLDERNYVGATVGGELPAPVSAALWRIAKPRSGECWLDSACRSGLNLIEAPQTDLKKVALDLHPPCLDATSINAEAAGQRLSSALWDGHHLPCAPSSVDGVVTDLSRRTEFKGVCHWLETHRAALKLDGRIVVLCDRDRDLEDRLESGSLPFRQVSRHSIKAAGRSRSAYHLRTHT